MVKVMQLMVAHSVRTTAQYSVVASDDLTHLTLMCQSEASIAGPM